MFLRVMASGKNHFALKLFGVFNLFTLKTLGQNFSHAESFGRGQSKKFQRYHE